LSGRRALVAIVVAGAAVRFATLGIQSFAEDESTTALLMLHPFGSMLSSLPDSETTPPLFYVLDWLVAHPFGVTEVSARLISAAAGTATVAVAAAAADVLAGRRAAVICALLVAFNPFLVWYSQEARAYALLVLLTAIALLFYIRLLRDPGDRRSLVGWSVASALALLTHYFAIFVIAAEGVWILRRVLPRRRALAALAPAIVTGAALLPLLYAQTHPTGRSFHQKFQVPHAPLPARALRLPREWALGLAAPAGKVLAFVVLAVLAWGAIELYRRAAAESRHRAAIVAAIGLAGVLVPIAGALGGKSVDFVASRNLIAAVVPLLVVAACGLACTPATRVVVAVPAIIGLFVVVVVAADRSYQRPDYRDAVAALGKPRGWRVIAMNRRLADPLIFYAEKTGPTGRMTKTVVTTELDVLSLPALGRRHAAPIARLRPPLATFRLVTTWHGGSAWRAARFRPAGPATFGPPALRRSAPQLANGSIVAQVPPRSR
jgi:mannosyltransferase